MTISYSGNFLRLLMRWKGSIWRSVWKELLIYLVFFYIIRIYYLFGIDYSDEDKDDRRKMRRQFEAICHMCDNYTKLIPLTFLLGFYVSNVVSRWWRQFECLYWPEDIVSILCSVIPSNEESAQKRRHQIARYVNLASALAWRDISSKIRMRFPTIQSMIVAGLITNKEYEMLEEAHDSCDTIRWMTPLHWIQQLLKKEEAERSPPASLMNNILTELKVFRQSIRRLFCYDWVCVPLVYTQVAALATYAFFFFSLFGRQTLLPNIESGAQIELYLPVFSIVQFLFFVGWFKVGQDLMRPFGLDDDDIELNYILDRNISTTFAMVNKLQGQEPPEFEEDTFWKTRESKVDPLPHSKYSVALIEHKPHLHSYIPMDAEESDKTSQDCFRSRKDKKHIGW